MEGLESPATATLAAERAAPSRRSRLVVLLLVLLGAAGCGPRPEPVERILLIAVDGLEWRVALPLVQGGHMPELRALMERGSHGWLETLAPTRSPVIWTSVATSKNPESHGISGFDVSRGDRGGTRLVRSFDRRTKAFWNILSDYGRTVNVIGWWVTYPVEAINGLMVAQTNTVSMRETRRMRKGSLAEGMPHQVHPPDREAEIFAILHETEGGLNGIIERTFGDAARPQQAPLEALLEASRWSLRADATYAAIAEELAREGAFDLMAVYLGGADVVGHRFWRYLEPAAYRHPPTREEAERFGGIIPSYYVYLDRIIGKLRDATPGTPTVFVVSDHGMAAYRTDAPYRPDDPLRELNSGNHANAEPGVFVAAGPRIRRSGRVASRVEDLPTIGSIYDVTPTLLALLDLPVGEDMVGSVLGGVIEEAPLRRCFRPTVASHDDGAWVSERARLRAESVEGGASDRDDPERIEQLRALGYVE